MRSGDSLSVAGQGRQGATFVVDFRAGPSATGGSQRWSLTCEGQRFGLHNMRHSLSTWLANKGKIDPKTVQGMLRHSDIRMTMNLYTQDDRDEKQAAQGAFLDAVGLGSRLVQRFCGSDCGLSLEVPYKLKSFALYGGDDGARTRDLCRDRSTVVGNS